MRNQWLMFLTTCRRMICILTILITTNGCTYDSLKDRANRQQNITVEPEQKIFLRLSSFEKPELPSNLITQNARSERVKRNAYFQSGDKNDFALLVDFATENALSSHIEWRAREALDWSKYQSLTIAVDIANPMSESAHLMFNLSNVDGVTHNSNVLIPRYSSGTYHIVITGNSINIETGMRASPPAPPKGVTQFIWRHGDKNIDLSKVSGFKFSFSELANNKRLIFDNIILIESLPYDPDYMNGVTDAFGQNAFVEFSNKIENIEDLRAKNLEEQAQLDDVTMPDRSKFGGFKFGPRLKATGYFRTVKFNNKWWLVDPEGFLFFSHGIANVRMANTTTITGMDFSDPSVRAKDTEELTPEDSKGIEPISGAALSTRHIASKMRRDMFLWLPEYKEPLANHYSYRKSTHQGVLQHGETFSFYQANLERKYGETSPNSFLKDWRETTIKRMRNWGFTSFGNWIDPMFYDNTHVPFFANGWIIGNFKTVSTGADYWSPLPDPFDPEFAHRARITIEQIAQEINNNPWCIGIFIDNEKSWGNTSSPEARFAIVLNTLAQDALQSPSKQQFLKLLKTKYIDIDSLNVAWEINLESWDVLASGVKITQVSNDTMFKDLSDMSVAYASEYFRIVNHEIKRVLPNHLYMGARLADWGTTPEVLRASAQYADVMSYNQYSERLHPEYWQFLEKLDMPSIIGEFHIGAFDSGYFNPGLVFAQDQTERAKMYLRYMESVIANPYMVGGHWFQYIDSPVTGRAYDGENYNVGFVSVTDTPYPEMVQAAKQFNSEIYRKRLGFNIIGEN